jgi:transposase
MTPPLLTPPPAERVVRRRIRRDPQPRFKQDCSAQLDAVAGCPAAVVPPGHLAWTVRSQIERLDLSALEAGYSSLGRHGYHPRQVLGVWVYASLVGMHHSTKVARALKTDNALRLLSGGHAISEGKLRRFRRENRAFFEDAIAQTAALAHRDGWLDTDALAVDSMRLRAHASTKAVRTLKRSTERLAELAAVDVTTLDDAARAKHEDKLLKHRTAVAQCQAQQRASVVTTNESAALMKFPSGAALPGHRITVTAAGVKQRFVVGVLVDSATNDYGKLGPMLEQAHRVLTQAGVAPDVPLQAAADAGYAAVEDYAFADANRAWVDVLVPVADGDSAAGTRKGYFGRERFTLDGDGATCPAGKAMRGPFDNGDGRNKWLGVGCGDCTLKSQCTPGRERSIAVDVELERLRAAMRQRMQQPAAQQRYNQRIATVEPVFAGLQDTMAYRRASARHSASVVAEALLKILAYNLSRLAAARRLSCVLCYFEPLF